MTKVAATFLALFIVASSQAGELRGKVVSIADGDTLTILDASNEKHKIRLIGIDAPESKQAWGTKSKQTLSGKVGEKSVRIEWKEKDRYGRILGDVFIDDRNINLEMVESGMAWHYRQYSKDKRLSDAEALARKEKRGLWADKDPEPPWEFRKREREKK